jgi:hypothetical protein
VSLTNAIRDNIDAASKGNSSPRKETPATGVQNFVAGAYKCIGDWLMYGSRYHIFFSICKN